MRKEDHDFQRSDFLLRMIVEEMNRSRDWPLKILGFTSALHFGILVAIISSGVVFSCGVKAFLTLLFTVLMFWTIYYFRRCHFTYLELRNSQIELELQLGIKNMGVLPEAWLNKRLVSSFTAFWGWGYYLFIAVAFWLSVIGVLWLDITVSKAV